MGAPGRSAGRRAAPRVLLFDELRIFVANTDEEWEQQGLEVAETKANEFLRRRVLENKDPFLQLDVEGSCEDGRYFLADGGIARQLFVPVRDFIVSSLMRQAAQLTGEDAQERLDLAEAIHGGPVPRPAVPVEETTGLQRYLGRERLRLRPRRRQGDSDPKPPGQDEERPGPDEIAFLDPWDGEDGADGLPGFDEEWTPWP
jgi:hypothetical protein